MAAIDRAPDAGEWGNRLHQPIAQPAPAELERGHGRGKTTYHVVGGSPELRGVPLIGTGAGGLANTRPGGEVGAVKKLEAELRDIQGSRTFNGQVQFEVKVHVSATGVLRYRRVIL